VNKNKVERSPEVRPNRYENTAIDIRINYGRDWIVGSYQSVKGGLDAPLYKMVDGKKFQEGILMLRGQMACFFEDVRVKHFDSSFPVTDYDPIITSLNYKDHIGD
jgi:hypothetical protein